MSGAVNGPWDEAALEQFRAFDPAWAELGLSVSTPTPLAIGASCRSSS